MIIRCYKEEGKHCLQYRSIQITITQVFFINSSTINLFYKNDCKICLYLQSHICWILIPLKTKQSFAFHFLNWVTLLMLMNLYVLDEKNIFCDLNTLTKSSCFTAGRFFLQSFYNSVNINTPKVFYCLFFTNKKSVKIINGHTLYKVTLTTMYLTI